MDRAIGSCADGRPHIHPVWYLQNGPGSVIGGGFAVKVYVAVELTLDERGVLHPHGRLGDGRKFEITSFRGAARGEPQGRGQRHSLHLPRRPHGH
jgi:hypothetical protein